MDRSPLHGKAERSRGQGSVQDARTIDRDLGLVFAVHGVEGDAVRLDGPNLPGGLPELLVAALEARPVGKVHRAAWEMDLLPVNLLKPHDEHRAV
jgi:hypothetical protein